jgi:hypothetical protein
VNPDPTIILGATSFLLLIAVGFLMLHAAGLRRERDGWEQLAFDRGRDLEAAEHKRDELSLIATEQHARLQAALERSAQMDAASQRAAFIADGVRSLVAQADGQQ